MHKNKCVQTIIITIAIWKCIVRIAFEWVWNFFSALCFSLLSHSLSKWVHLLFFFSISKRIILDTRIHIVSNIISIFQCIMPLCVCVYTCYAYTHGIWVDLINTKICIYRSRASRMLNGGVNVSEWVSLSELNRECVSETTQLKHTHFHFKTTSESKKKLIMHTHIRILYA